jgi:hypothetical protein
MKHQQLQRRWLRVGCAFAVVGAIASLGATRARADDGVDCPDSAATPYTMQLKALTGPAGADLTVTLAVDTTTKCVLPDAIKKVQLKTF